MRPDSGCYEEPYRLTWQVAGILALGLLAIAGGALPGQGVVGLALIGLGVLAVLPLAVLIVSHRAAVRADGEGITFGPHPVPYAPGRRFCWVFAPWDDVKEIRLVKEPFGWGGRGGKFIRAVPRHRGGAADGQSLPLAYCRLDLERLAAVTAAHAPRVAIVDTRNTDADPDAESRSRWGFLK